MVNQRSLFLLLICCASGAASLAYEVIYLRMLTSFVVGEIYYVMASILFGVFSGLAIGAFGAFVVLPILWILEILLGIFSAAIATVCFIWGVELATFFPEHFGLTIFLTFILGFLPFFFIGAALPCFSILLAETNVSKGSFLTVYAIYNFVAALSIFVAEFILSRIFGLIATLFIYASISFLIGIFLRVFNFGRRQSERDTEFVSSSTTNEKGIYGVMLILGAVGVVWQLLFLDFVWAVFGPFQETFSLVLFAVIFGIAISAWVGRDISSSPNMLLFSVGGVLLTIFLAYPFLWIWTQTLSVDIIGSKAYWLRLGLLFIVAVPIFASFGLAVPIIHAKRLDIPYGVLLGCLSSGNALGILCYSLAIRGILDPPTSSAIIIALVLFCWGVLQNKKIRIYPIAISFSVVVGATGYYTYPTGLLLSGSVKFLYSHNYDSAMEQMNSGAIKIHNFSGYGLHSNVMEEVSTGRKTIIHSGYRVFKLDEKDLLIHRETSHSLLAYLFSPKSDNLYLVGLGTGVTAMAGSRLFNHVDIIDINPMMENISNQAFAEYNDKVLSNHNVSLTFQDALVDMSRRKQKYNAIINGASSPYYFSANKIFTKDFFQIAAQRLTDDGVYVGWVDVEGGIKSVFKLRNTLLSVFSACKFYALDIGYYGYVCSLRPLRMRYKNSDIFAFGKKIFDSIEIPDAVFAQTKNYEINTLDRPILSYPKDLYHGREDTYDFLKENIMFERVYKEKVCCEDDQAPFCVSTLYFHSCAHHTLTGVGH